MLEEQKANDRTNAARTAQNGFLSNENTSGEGIITENENVVQRAEKCGFLEMLKSMLKYTRGIFMNEKNLTLSSPWMKYYKKLQVLFGQDPAVKMELEDIAYKENMKEINIYVDGDDKANAIETLLPGEIDFGNISVAINVVPSNEIKEPVQLFREAFAGNPIFCFAESQRRMGATFDFVVFKDEVARYFNDDLGDIYGFRSTLYQEIAKEVFSDYIYTKFCTRIPGQDVLTEEEIIRKTE